MDNSRTNYNGRHFLKALGIGAASCAFPNFLFPANKTILNKEKSNILFIAVDDLRPQLGCYGHNQMISPNIDRIASTGTVFKRTYCQVPVYGASRASLLPGVRPTRTRFVDFKTMAEQDLPHALNLPKYLKDHGYNTISNGKIFHHKMVHGYYACVSCTDFQIGRLLDELDRLGMRENTIIVLWGDHGWNLGEHGLWCKHCNFETSLHSPLIIGYKTEESDAWCRNMAEVWVASDRWIKQACLECH